MDKIHLYDKILSPIVTEKSTNMSEQNKIVFKVPVSANKKNLKSNIEKIFKVNVTKINIINIKYVEKVTSFFTLCFSPLIRKKYDFPQPPERCTNFDKNKSKNLGLNN